MLIFSYLRPRKRKFLLLWKMIIAYTVHACRLQLLCHQHKWQSAAPALSPITHTHSCHTHAAICHLVYAFHQLGKRSEFSTAKREFTPTILREAHKYCVALHYVSSFIAHNLLIFTAKLEITRATIFPTTQNYG